MSGLVHGGWVLVCDGSKALFLRNAGTRHDLRLEVVRKHRQDNPPAADQGTDRPGRRSDGPSGHRSALAQTDFHELAEDRFARDLADRLHGFVEAGAFAEIVLVAAPAVLGELRAAMPERVRDRVTGEVPKTLTNHPMEEITAILSDTLA